MGKNCQVGHLRKNIVEEAPFTQLLLGKTTLFINLEEPQKVNRK